MRENKIFVVWETAYKKDGQRKELEVGKASSTPSILLGTIKNEISYLFLQHVRIWVLQRKGVCLRI